MKLNAHVLATSFLFQRARINSFSAAINSCVSTRHLLVPRHSTFDAVAPPLARMLHHHIRRESCFLARKQPMRILMLTNTYPPVISGVARSIVAFDEHFRGLGHEVKV